MSLSHAQMLAALGIAQATKIAPVLEGTYEGGDAGTLAMLLLLLAQDLATLPARQARETAAMADLLGEQGDHEALLAMLAARHAAIDGTADPLNARILAFYVEMTGAALLTMPAL